MKSEDATPRLHSWHVRRMDAWSSLVRNESKQSRVRSVRQNLEKAAECIVGKLHFVFPWFEFGFRGNVVNQLGGDEDSIGLLTLIGSKVTRKKST